MRPEHSAEIQTLRTLWRQQIEYTAGRPQYAGWLAYGESQFGLDITLERRLRVIDMVIPYVRGSVLEWGCHAGVDSCIYKLRLGNRVELYGCDVLDPPLYQPFYDFSGLRYSQITHDYRLDYPDDFFDVVTSDGVLEHVPDELHSIQEIHRILKPDGTFVVTCLPNRYSYTELYQRARKGPAHERLYTLGTARHLLEQRDFEVTHMRPFFMLPTMLNGFPQTLRDAYQRREHLVWRTNRALEAAWPLNRLASNLMLVARKRR